MSLNSSTRLVVNLGSQSNDGTGDAIRDAFDKVNINFETIFNVAGLGSGLKFTKLADGPTKLYPNRVIGTDATGLTVTQFTAVGGGGIQVSIDQSNKQLLINSTITNLVNDPAPTLSADLSGASLYRAENFVDPVDDQDLATKKWIYDNFLNRDSNYQYISSYNPITHANVTATIVEGSTLRHNIRLEPTTSNNVVNVGKSIKVHLADGTTSTVDISVGGWLPSHLTRKDYVDTKISLQGIDTLDPATGAVNTGFGTMTGPLYLSRDPMTQDPSQIAATKGYVDTSVYVSKQNFYVSLTGNDADYTIPSFKRGRGWAWAFKTLNKAAQAALQYSESSEIKLGVYQRLITTQYTTPVTIFSVGASPITGAQRLTVLYNGGAGTDPFVEGSVRPGMYLQGVNSNAIAEILSVTLNPNSNVQEFYDFKYVDYAQTFVSSITPNARSGDVTFTFNTPNLINIPDFWVGYTFHEDNSAAEGTIISIGSYYDVNGNVFDTITVRLSSPLTNTNTIAGPNWHVYSGYFSGPDAGGSPGEELRYGQRYNKTEISILVESGEFNEQLPIRIGDNVSVKGDEFRRTVIKPAYVLQGQELTARSAISTSPFAGIYFRRDTQLDGMIVVSINTSTDYSQNVAVTPDSSTNNSASGVITFTLASGTPDPTWVGKVFYDPRGAQGEIKTVIGNGFTVNIAENNAGIRKLPDATTIAAGAWQIYAPINFGYHYLRDPSRPMQLFAQANAGGYVNAAKILENNKQFIQSEIVAYIVNKYSGTAFAGGFTLVEQNKCYRDIGYFVDALAYDLKYGDINCSVNAGDAYRAANVTYVLQNELPQTIDAIGYFGTLTQQILLQQAVTPTTGNSADQVITRDIAETASTATAADLVSAMVKILGNDPTFNPPKYNDQIDMFLMNDATMLRYLGGNGHGGFMKVLDPEGQIKSKSPYTQTCSSFAQSIGRHRFAGGFFVDGFTGNIQVTTTQGFASADFFGNLIKIPVSGMYRLPKTPCFFLYQGIKYEVDFIDAYDSVAGTGQLSLNPNNAGGIANVAVGTVVNEWQPSTTISATFSSPEVAGGVKAQGYATVNGSGSITSFTVTLPGNGYKNPPTISLGGATFNFVITGGVITSMTVNNGGSGYTTGTRINIAAPGGNGLTAQATIDTIGSGGIITGIILVNGGSGYSSIPVVTFGQQTLLSTITVGFIGTLPSTIELVGAGNRSMLANDFTQLNDLGYGIFATNGGFIENVSMFTYYAYTSYYALNGAQLRTITGSSAYGTYGLVSEGSDPLEVPTPIVLPDNLTQIVYIYNQAPYSNVAAAGIVYVAAYNQIFDESELEISHYGTVQKYSVSNSFIVNGVTGVDGRQVYGLAINTITGGLLQAVPDGWSAILRVKNQWRLYGLNSNTITRTSTVLNLSEDPTYYYRVLSYTDLGSDYTIVETDQSYDYVLLNPWSISNQPAANGLSQPTILNSGTGYTTSATWAVTFESPLFVTGTIVTTQGTAIAPQAYFTATVGTLGQANIALPGMAITGTNVLSSQFVTYTDYQTYKSRGWVTVGTTYPQVWNYGNVYFTGITAQGYAVANTQTGHITGIHMTHGGIGYQDQTDLISKRGYGIAVTIAGPVGGGTTATASVSVIGGSNSTRFKIQPLTGTSLQRMFNFIDYTGINETYLANNQRFYEFGQAGSIGGVGSSPYFTGGVKQTVYSYIPPGTGPGTTGGDWAEIDVGGPFGPFANGAANWAGSNSLNRAVSPEPLYAGVKANSSGTVTIRISTLRATSHDMIDVGTGGYATSKIPNDLYGPPTIKPNQAYETIEIGKGRVYYVTTDQNGNFRVGKYFSVDQGRGTVTISAPISLTGISELGLKKGTVITAFSTDDTFAQDSNLNVPTEAAIVSYLDHRLGVTSKGSQATGSAIGPGVMALNGVNPMSASMNMGGNPISNLQDPLNATDATTKAYTDTKVSLSGMNEATYKGGQSAGVMTGPLTLSGDPGVNTATVISTAATSSVILYLNSVSGLYLGQQLNNPSLVAGTKISSINSVNNTIGISVPAFTSVSSGTIITFDSVNQSASKRYVDRSAQLSQLRDVYTSGAADTDLLMFAGLQSANSATTTPIYNASRTVINVTNSASVVTNTPTAVGGGSDVSFSRTGNFLTVKILGSTAGTNSPITDYHVNNSAAIQQKKLLMQAAGTLASAPGSFTQSSLGLSVFDSNYFQTTNGWVTLNLSNGLVPKTTNTYNLGSATYQWANVYATNLYGTLSASNISGILSVSNGGTGASNTTTALTNLLANAGTPTAGYILTTSGTGSYYWAPAPGSGVQTGSRINSARLSYTATAGQTVFTTPTYVVGASQLRVYVNGVRQDLNNSDYTETSTTSVTLSTGLNVNDHVLIEVDGYINYQITAQSTSFLATGNISANNVQDGMVQLDSIKMGYAGGTFTGNVTMSGGKIILAPGTTSLAPLQLQAGTNLTTAVAGSVEWDGSNLYITASGPSRQTVAFQSWVTGLGYQTASGSVANATNAVNATYAGTATIANQLNTANSYQIASLGVNTAAGSTGEIRATGDITAYYSDDRLKTKLGKIEGALDKICALEGFYYEANQTAQDLGYAVKREVGVSAQSTNAVMPEIVASAPISEEYLTVKYERFAPLFIEAIKELRAEIEEIKKALK